MKKLDSFAVSLRNLTESCARSDWALESMSTAPSRLRRLSVAGWIESVAEAKLFQRDVFLSIFFWVREQEIENDDFSRVEMRKVTRSNARIFPDTHHHRLVLRKRPERFLSV